MRCSISLFSLAIVMVASACVGSDTVGPTDPPEPPVLQFITITRDTNFLMMGDTGQHKCVAHYDKGPKKEKDCTPLAMWTSSVPSVATVAKGVVTAVGPGDSQIGASFEGKTVAVHISVIPLPVTPVSISVKGDSILEAPGPLQLSAFVNFSDGTTEDVTALATWSYPNSDYPVGEVDSLGLVTPNGLGSLHVTADYQDLSGSIWIEVVGTPQSSLPDASPAAWDLLLKYFPNSNGVFSRQDISVPLTLWVGLGIPAQNVSDAVALWATDSEGKIQYVQVTDSVDARFKMYLDSANTVGVCAWGGPSGRVTINPFNPNCVRRSSLAHELGRTLGFMWNFPSDTDIMSSPSVWKSDPLRVEILNLAYSIPIGVIIIRGQ